MFSLHVETLPANLYVASYGLRRNCALSQLERCCAVQDEHNDAEDTRTCTEKNITFKDNVHIYVIVVLQL